MDENSKMKSSWGGARPNAGRPLGSLNKETKEVRAVEAELRSRTLQHADVLFHAQLNLARGCTYVYRIDERKDGNKIIKEHVLVTDPEEIKSVLDQGDGTNTVVDDHYYFITTEAPDNKAIDSMWDRVFGKATSRSEIDHTTKGEKITGNAIVLQDFTHAPDSQ